MHYLDYNEKKQHGTPDFPIEYYHVDEHHPRYNMPFHCHKELEIIRILEGILYLKLDDEELEAKAGDIILSLIHIFIEIRRSIFSLDISSAPPSILALRLIFAKSSSVSIR